MLVFSDEIKLTSTAIRVKIENSLLDADEFTEKERFEICKKTLPMLGACIKLVEGTRTSLSRYYILQRSGTSPEMSSEAESSNAGGIVQGIVQAFQCPTDPKIYIHVNYQKHAGPTVWIMMREPVEQYSNFTYIGFQLKTFLDIIRGAFNFHLISPNNGLSK